MERFFSSRGADLVFLLLFQVPLFERLDYLVLDAICERLKPQLFIRGSCIIRQGDPGTTLFSYASNERDRPQILA